MIYKNEIDMEWVSIFNFILIAMSRKMPTK